jgi:uncharacterized protein DUF1963
MLRPLVKAILNFAFGGLLFAWSGVSIIKGCLSLESGCTADVGWPVWLIAAASLGLIFTGIFYLAVFFALAIGRATGTPSANTPARKASSVAVKSGQPDIGDAARARIAEMIRKASAEAGKLPVPPPAAPKPDPGGISGFEDVVSQFAEPALALIRPYPPSDEPAPRSRFGGLPELPEGAAWPRTVSDGEDNTAGVPLHFMAQIDLNEMPWLPDTMPDTGTLLFFARVDEEMLWGDQDPRNDVQVIYDPGSKGVLTEPPPDMPPIMAGYCEFDQTYHLEGEPLRTVYPSWPLTAYPIMSVPEAGAFPRDGIPLGDAVTYNAAYRKFRADQVTNATGIPALGPERPEPPIDFDTSTMDGKDVTTVRPEQSSGYPWAALTMALTIRAVLKGCGKTLPEPFKADTLAMLRAVEATDPTAVPSAEETDAFIGWLNKLLTEPGFAKSRHVVLNTVTCVLREIAIRAGGDATLASRFPAALYAYQAQDHAPVYADRRSREPDGSPKTRIEIHQMFGRVPSTQSPALLGDTAICLLQLRSDYGAGLMLCDVGEAEFWIKPEDLAARAFDKVWGFTCGG